jgi:predicted nucleotidyltransferase
MIPSADDPGLQELVSRLVKAYCPDFVYLLGSVARGDANEDSDYDILLIVPDDAERERWRNELARQALSEVRLAADVLIFTRTYFDSRLHRKASFPSTIVREGKLLYPA